MQYVNPFNLLSLQVIDPEKIKKAKKRLLADIELSETNSIQIHGVIIMKSELLRIIDELDDKDKYDYHSYIFHNNALNNFLSVGSLNLFENFRYESIYKVSKFRDFVSPFFAEKYDKILTEHYKLRNQSILATILNVKPIVNDFYLHRCYKGVFNILQKRLSEIEKVYSNLKEWDKSKINDKLPDIVKFFNKSIDSNLINLLPIDFQRIRNEIAYSLYKCSVLLHNTYDQFTYAYEIANISISLKIDGLTERNISKNYSIIKSNYQDFLDRTKEKDLLSKHSKEIEQFNDIVDQLNKLINEMKTKSNSSSNIRNTLKLIFFNLTNGSINFDIFTNTRYSIVSKLRILSNLICEKSNDLELALEVLNFTSHLNVSEEVENKISEDIKLIENKIDNEEYHGTPIISTPLTGNYFIFGLNLYNDTIYFTILAIPILPINRYSVNLLHTKNQVLVQYNGILKLTIWQKVWKVGLLSLVTFLIIFHYFRTDDNSIEQEREQRSYTSSNLEVNQNIKDASLEPAEGANSKIVSMKNGNIQGYPNIKYDNEIDNELKISVGNNADVAIKLYNIETYTNSRYVYINSGTTFTIRHIPQGKYYLKIAYGNDWLVKDGELIWQGRFSKDEFYEQSEDILDFTIIETAEGYSIPSYSLKLDLIVSDGLNNQFNTNSLSAYEFYYN